MRHLYRKLAGLLAFSLATASPSLACQCVQRPDDPSPHTEAFVRKALDASDTVFVGQVVALQHRGWLRWKMLRLLVAYVGREPTEEKEDRIIRRRVRFSVIEPFKGTPQRRITVYTRWGGGDCGYPFAHGSHYLVYASRTTEGWLATDICDATAAIANAGPDLAILRTLPE
jgi:hypothetical protein